MNWQIASSTLLGIALLGGFAWYERSRPSAKVLSLVAALAALAVVGRIAFAPFPNVKPVTDIVLLSGYALGGAPGFAVGAVTALASNIFFSQGPWTPWQMAAWGGVGIAGAGLARLARGREPGRVPLALICGAAALAFGAVMDVYQWTLGAEQTFAAYVAVSATSLPYNLAHAIGSVVLCLVFGPALLRALLRYRRRFEVRWAPARPSAATPLAAAVLALAAVSVLAAPPSACANGKAARYLERAQNGDGGFGSAPGEASNQLMTGWAGLGLAAAGHNPQDVKRGKRSLIDYVRRNAGSLNDTGELSRTILLVKAAGLSPRRFAGRDLVAQLQNRRRSNGSFDGLVNQTAFGILALRAGGAGGIGKPARWLAGQQNGEGRDKEGFGFNGQPPSDVDVTGAVLQALAVAGRRGGKPAEQAAKWLRGAQQRGGGFAQRESGSPNAQSSAFAAQGLVAVGRGAGGPIKYIRSLQRSDGSVRYSRASDQDPVWVTGQALLALERDAFPLGAVPRRASGGGGSAGDGGSGGEGGAASGAASGSGAAGAGGAGPLHGDKASREGKKGDRRSGYDSPSALGPEGITSPATSVPTQAATTDLRSSGGSVLGGVISAAASGAFVVGVRRRLRKRLHEQAGLADGASA